MFFSLLGSFFASSTARAVGMALQLRHPSTGARRFLARRRTPSGGVAGVETKTRSQRYVDAPRDASAVRARGVACCSGVGVGAAEKGPADRERERRKAGAGAGGCRGPWPRGWRCCARSARGGSRSVPSRSSPAAARHARRPGVGAEGRGVRRRGRPGSAASPLGQAPPGPSFGPSYRIGGISRSAGGPRRSTFIFGFCRGALTFSGLPSPSSDRRCKSS